MSASGSAFPDNGFLALATSNAITTATTLWWPPLALGSMTTELTPDSLGGDDGHLQPQLSSTTTLCHSVSAPVRKPSKYAFYSSFIILSFTFSTFSLPQLRPTSPMTMTTPSDNDLSSAQPDNTMIGSPASPDDDGYPAHPHLMTMQRWPFPVPTLSLIDDDHPNLSPMTTHSQLQPCPT